LPSNGREQWRPQAQPYELPLVASSRTDLRRADWHLERPPCLPSTWDYAKRVACAASKIVNRIVGCSVSTMFTHRDCEAVDCAIRRKEGAHRAPYGLLLRATSRLERRPGQSEANMVRNAEDLPQRSRRAPRKRKEDRNQFLLSCHSLRGLRVLRGKHSRQRA